MFSVGVLGISVVIGFVIVHVGFIWVVICVRQSEIIFCRQVVLCPPSVCWPIAYMKHDITLVASNSCPGMCGPVLLDYTAGSTITGWVLPVTEGRAISLFYCLH